MAGGPYKGNQGGYYCRWSDSRGHPQDDKKAESLKTKKKGEAIKRLSILETLQQSGYHDPWQRKWFDNSQIKNIVFSGYLDIEALQSGQLTAKNVTLLEAAEEYIQYKSNQKGRKGWKTRRTIQSHSHTIRQFANFTGPAMQTTAITEQDLHRFYQRDEFESDYSKRTMRSRLNGFINFLIDKGYRSKKIDAEVNPPQRQVREYIRKEKMLQIFDLLEKMQAKKQQTNYNVIDTSWYGDFCRMNYDSGLRGSEQIQLKLADITDSDIIVGKSFRVKTNAQRKVAIGNGLAKKVINKYTDEDFRKTDPILSDSDYLFGRSSESTRARISSALKQASKQILTYGRYITLHKLRHLSAMKFLMENKNKDEGTRLLLLMHRLGHQQLSTTSNYLDFLPSDGMI